MLGKLGTGVVDFLLPPRCPACGERIMSHGHLCAACWNKLVPISDPLCNQCGLPFEYNAGDRAHCGSCMKELPAFDWARAAVSYDDLGKSLVLKLKHGKSGAGVPALAAMMARLVPPERSVDIIVPVPLHRKRLLQRRFNQSQLLASALGKKLGLPCDPFVLERRRATPSQGTLGRKARLRNVEGAFNVSESRRVRIDGASVLLVDDVLTTGATASACAKTLKRFGAKEVGVVAFARVALPRRS